MPSPELNFNAVDFKPTRNITLDFIDVLFFKNFNLILFKNSIFSKLK
jgi:hypothetical protein